MPLKICTSIIIWVTSSILTITLFVAELFFTVILYPFDKKRKVAHAQCFWWSAALVNLNPYWNLALKGLENIDKRETYVVVANHQSLADIIILYRTRMQFKWVAKESLFKVPFVGWCMSLAKYIKLTRGEFSSVKKVYREAAQWLRKDVSVFFFPEGTRSKTDRMNEFQNGAFKLAIKEKRRVLPISIKWTRNAIKKGSWIFDANALCKITVLPPIDTSGLKPGDFPRLRDLTYKRLGGVTA
jgi:1-acyl-sn-glycerol-3-phosphate acyltransferase